MKFTEFLCDVGRPLTYYPALALALGCVKAAIFLANLIYWTGKQADPNGWIYKSSDEIELETGLPYDQQRTARKRLKRQGLIEERYARLDHRLYFRPHIEAINAAWEAWLAKSKESISSTTTRRLPRQEVDSGDGQTVDGPTAADKGGDKDNTDSSITDLSNTHHYSSGGELVWPKQLTPAARSLCERELIRCPSERMSDVVRQLSHRLTRAHDPLRLPHLYVRTLVRAAASGTFVKLAPAAPLSAEQRTKIEQRYQQLLASARSRGDRELGLIREG